MALGMLVFWLERLSLAFPWVLSAPSPNKVPESSSPSLLPVPYCQDLDSTVARNIVNLEITETAFAAFSISSGSCVTSVNVLAILAVPGPSPALQC